MTEARYMSKNNPGLGIEFEVLVPALFCLELFENEEVEDFVIESNVKGFGNLDDLIVHIKLKNGEERFFAFQLKHAEHDTKNLLPGNLTGSGQFYLQKYCENFANLKSDKYHIILYTNRRFDAAKTKDVTLFDMNKKNDCPGYMFFNTSQEDSPIYGFGVKEEIQLPKGPTKDNYDKFFKQFSLYTSQKNSKSLELKIQELLKERYSAPKSVSVSYVDFFRRWHKSEFCNMKITKEIVHTQLFLLLITNCVKYYNSLFNPEEKKVDKILKSAVHKFDITTVETIDSTTHTIKDPSQGFNKDHIEFGRRLKILPKVVTDQDENKSPDKKKLSIEEKLNVLFCHGTQPALLNFNEDSKDVIDAAVRVLSKNRNLNVKLIIYGQGIDRSNFSGFKIFRNLRDLFDVDKNLYFDVLENFHASLQGRGFVSLGQIMNENVAGFIKTDDLFRGLNDCLRFGAETEANFENYLERAVTTVSISDEFLLLDLKEDLVIINCGNKLDAVEANLSENTATKKICRLEDFSREEDKSAIVLTQEDFPDLPRFEGNIHFLRAIDQCSFQWVSTKGTIQNLRSGAQPGTKTLNEEDVFENCRNDVNVVCAMPGMGKSMLMNSLQKKCPSDYWVAAITLREYNPMFKQFKETINEEKWEETFYGKVLSKNQGIQSEIEEVLRCNRKIYFFFDGLDELDSHNVETAIKFVQKLASNGFKIWISSRTNFRELLEESFNSFPLKIEEFSKENQECYIKNRLSQNNTYKSEEIETIIQRVFESTQLFNNSEILGAPLQLHILTEIFLENKDLYRDFNEKNFVITEMYESFFNGKFQHYFKGSALSEAFKENFEIAALKSCLDGDFFETLKIENFGQCLSRLEPVRSKIGIITKIQDGVPVFEHSTHAEYFAASYFAKHYKKIDLKRLFEKRYDNIRLLFDIILAEKSLPHLATIYRDFRRLEAMQDDKINCLDKGGRSPLHLACSYGEKFSILQVENKTILDQDVNAIDENNLQISKNFVKSFLEAGCNCLKTDEVYKWNSLHYADASLNLAAFEEIAQNNRLDSKTFKNSISTYKKNYATILYFSSKYGFVNLFKTIHNILGKSILHPVKLREYKQLLQLTNHEEETFLHSAAESRNFDLVKLLLKDGISVNSIDASNLTALDIAISLNHSAIQSLLKSKGAKINALKKFEKYPLQLAAKDNSAKLIKMILDQGEIDIDNKDKDNWTALHHATRHGNVKAMQVLLKSGADIEAITNLGETALFLGTYYGQVEAINLLLMKGAKINICKNNGETLIQRAISKKQPEALELLLKKNIVLRARNNFGEEALHLAVKYENIDALNVLLNHEVVNIECRNHLEETPLHYAASRSLEISKILLEKNADVQATNGLGESVLHIAAAEENLEVMKYLIDDCGFDVNIRDNNGNTPLHSAINEIKSKSIEMLLESKAGIHIFNNDGLAPIHIAIESNNLSAVTQLLKHGDNIERFTEDLKSPLFLAVSYDNFYAVEFLLDKGADVKTMSQNGETLLHRAVAIGNIKMLNFLLDKGLDVDVSDHDFITPLMLSVKLRKFDIASVLLVRGARIEGDEHCEKKPLQIAEDVGDFELVRVLKMHEEKMSKMKEFILQAASNC